jgi:hypothetical protein
MIEMTKGEKSAVNAALVLGFKILALFAVEDIADRPGLLKCALRIAIMLVEEAEQGSPANHEMLVEFALMEFRQAKANHDHE